MVPNHVMQLLSLVAMESPVSFQADAVRDEQAKVLHAMQPLASEDVLQCSVRGQYADGFRGEEHFPAYRLEPGVAPESRTKAIFTISSGARASSCRRTRVLYAVKTTVLTAIPIASAATMTAVDAPLRHKSRTAKP